MTVLLIILPANAFEQDVVTFRAVLDASQQTHGCVRANRVVELHRVQILYRDPPENSSIRTQKRKNMSLIFHFAYYESNSFVVYKASII